MRINFYLLRTFCSHLGRLFFFFALFLLSLRFGQISPLAFFRWFFLPRPRIGMMSLVTVSPVITAFQSCCLSHHVFDQVNLWPAWVAFETAIFWNRTDSTPLSAAPQTPKGDQGWIFWSYKSLSGLLLSCPYRIFVIVFNWNHFVMRLLNLRINFYLWRTFCPHLGGFFFHYVSLLGIRLQTHHSYPRSR